MKISAKRVMLLVGLIAFALIWVTVMSMLGASERGAERGADGSTASVRYVDEGAFPKIGVYLAVQDAAGEPIVDLTQDKFSVTEDDVPVTISDFTGAGYQPITAILVIDRSGSMADDSKMGGAQEAAQIFLRELQIGRDKIGVIVFENRWGILQALEIIDAPRRDRLITLIGEIEPTGGTAYYDAIYEAIKQLETSPGRRVILALTDGKDNQSNKSFGDVTQYAQEQKIPIFTIGLGRDVNKRMLERMAEETAGEYYYAPSAAELATLYQNIAQSLQNEYSFTYESPTPKRDGTRRAVAVTIAQPGATLSTQDFYSPGGILSLSINPALFLALLLPLVALLFVPTLVKRLPKRELAPEPQVAPLPEQPYMPPPPAPQPAPTMLEPMTLPAPARLVRAYPLTKDITTIGAAAGNDILLAGIAPQQAQIRREGNRLVVYDLGAGGTAVSFSGNPAQVQWLQPGGRNALKHGSVVQFGDATFTVNQSPTGYAALEQTYSLAGGVVSIGSAMGNTIMLADVSVASRHAELRPEAGRWVVYDLSGGNTFVSFSGDPAQMRQVQKNALKDGSVVRLGRVELVVRGG